MAEQRDSDAPIANLADLELKEAGQGEHFASRMASIAPAIGAQQLGCRLTVVPPGKCAWPHHNHHANEELFVILSGSGTLRYGQRRYAVRDGDVIACPAGGPETAHQLINDGEQELRYLALSTMHAPDVMEYPDSDKVGVLAGSAPGGAKEQRRLSHFTFRKDAVGYWDGEDTG